MKQFGRDTVSHKVIQARTSHFCECKFTGLLLHLYSDSYLCCLLHHLIFLACNGSSIYCISVSAELLLTSFSFMMTFCSFDVWPFSSLLLLLQAFFHFLLLLSIVFNNSFYSFLSALYFGISLILDL